MFKLEVDEHRWAMKAMNCPGHMLLFGSQLRSYRELPLRYAEPAPLHRNEITGTLHGLLRVRHVTQDDAHIFCTQDQIQDEIADVVDYARYLYELFGLKASAELSTRPDNKLGTDEEWDMTEAALEEALKLNEIPYEIAPGEGAFYGPEDRPAHGGRARPQVADGDDPARLADAGTVRPEVRRAGQRRARPVRRPSRSLRVVRALHRHPHRALRGRVPVLARARSGAGASRWARTTARRRRRWPGSWASSASRSTTRTRRSASGSETPRSRRSRTCSSGATRSRRARSPCGSTAESSPRRRLDELLPELRQTLLQCEACKAGATCSSPPGPRACRGFNREGWEGSGRCCAAVLLFEEGGS